MTSHAFQSSFGQARRTDVLMLKSSDDLREAKLQLSVGLYFVENCMHAVSDLFSLCLKSVSRATDARVHFPCANMREPMGHTVVQNTQNGVDEDARPCTEASFFWNPAHCR
eukprot:4527844-Amphidinium_carterae.1